MEYFGNKNILKHHKTGFLCSRKCPADVVLKSYDWAKEQRETGNCIVCGNHSQIEKDVFEILLKGKQPIILVLARGLKTKWPNEWVVEVEKNRLLVLSPFPREVKRVTKETAIVKNKTIIEMCSKITIGYLTPKGQLDKLLVDKEYVTI